MDFKLFLEQSEEQKDIKSTLARIPKKHRALLRGFKIKMLNGNVLKNDKEHIGYMDDEKKEIVITAPWAYSKQHLFLHECGHVVYKTLSKELKQKWKKIVDNTTKPRVHQGYEEAFCHSYASTYCKRPHSIHDHKEWEEFIRSLP